MPDEQGFVTPEIDSAQAKIFRIITNAGSIEGNDQVHAQIALITYFQKEVINEEQEKALQSEVASGKIPRRVIHGCLRAINENPEFAKKMGGAITWFQARLTDPET